MKTNDLINDPRTIYSLAMVLILYEFYKSEFLTSEEPLFLVIKFGLLILIISQLIFLLLCGLSHAEYKDEHKENLLEEASLFYAAGFQSSVVFFMMGLFFIVAYEALKSFGIPFTVWGKILYIMISSLIAIGVIRIRKKYFNIRPRTNYWVYRIIALWMVIIILVILFKVD